MFIFVFLMIRRPPTSTRTYTLFPYTTLFRSIDQVVFDVAAAAQQLELPLALAERRGLAPLDDGQVGVEVGIADRTHEGETGVEIPLVQVVEEQPADPARLMAVLDVEIAIAPFLVARIDIRTKRRAGVPRDPVPVHAARKTVEKGKGVAVR